MRQYVGDLALYSLRTIFPQMWEFYEASAEWSYDFGFGGYSAEEGCRGFFQTYFGPWRQLPPLPSVNQPPSDAH